MRVLVCGGRDFGNIQDNSYDINTHKRKNNEYKFVIEWLNIRFDGPRDHLIIIHGGAKGVDTTAGIWAHLNRIPVIEYQARWKEHGRSAGPIRNQQMLDEGKPDLVIAFPGGRGTDDMVGRAKKAGIPVEGVQYP